MYSSQKGHIEIVRELIERGADLNPMTNFKKRKRDKNGHH